MIEWLKEIEQTVLLAINGLNSPFFDELMWVISGKFTWIPLYLLLFILVYIKYPLKKAIWFTVIGILAVCFADLTANYLFKHTIMRYRPSQHLVLGELLHYYEIKPGDFYRGGQYGFISGHATNSCAIATVFILQLKDKIKYIIPLLVFWVIIICYSRMYLGVHYPTDILGGVIWGTTVAFVFYWLYRKIIIHKYENKT